MGSGAGRYNGQELNATSPLRRDTVLIPAFSWMVLRFVTDNRERPSFTWNLCDVIDSLMHSLLTESGCMGVPLPHRVAYGSRAADADQ